MTIAGIGSSVSVFAARSAAHEKSSVAEMISSAGLSETDFANSPAAIVDISEPAKQMAQALPEPESEEKIDGSLKLTDILFSPEIQKAAHDRIIEITTRPSEPMDVEEQIRSWHFLLDSGSPEEKMDLALGNESLNSSWVTHELTLALRQTAFNKTASVEQRAINRESALKCAQYIADKYLDSGKKDKFMSAVNRIYTEDLYNDKGYYEIEPDKWVREGTSRVGGKNGKFIQTDYLLQGFTKAYSETHGIDDPWNFKTDSPEHLEFTNALRDFLCNSSLDEKLEMESYGKKLMDDKENAVDRATFKAKNNFNRELFNNNISRLLKAFEPKAS